MNKLLWSITSLGLDNISAISDYSGIPIETARYMIWHELQNHHVSVGIDIDFGRIGLAQWLIEIKKEANIQTIMGFLNGEIGLSYLPYTMVSDTVIAFVAIPENQSYKLEALLEYLVSIGAIRNYTMEKIAFSRHVSFDHSYYNFRKSEWQFDWKDVESRRMNKTVPSLSYPNSSRSPTVDYKDLLILREFQRKVPRSISKLASVLECDSFNARYHYNNHAKHAIKGYYLKVRPYLSVDEQSSFLFVYKFAKEKDFEEARRIALSLPFTTMEMVTEQTYAWFASLPGEYTNSTFRYLDQHFLNLGSKLKHFAIDSSTELLHTIPCELFDQNEGMWDYAPKIALNVLQKDFNFVKSTCKYQTSGICRIEKLHQGKCSLVNCMLVRE
ncbi:MAG: hypothetical protein ACYCQJ_07835 [Nitrososphaerales archaeon]